MKVVKEYPVPTSVKEVRQFLGLCSYYRKYIRSFCGIDAPLNQLTTKYLSRTLIWDTKTERNMRLLNTTWSNLSFNVLRSFVAMATNLPSCFLIQFLDQLLKFLLNFT